MSSLCWVALALAGTVSPFSGRDGGPLRPSEVHASPVSPAPVAAPPTASLYPSAAAALQVLLALHPRVLAIGEFHQTKATAGIPSALKRFTRRLLPVLHKAGATDLVVETWLATGSCGEVEKKAVAEVEKTTQRPARTENEVVTLILRAKRLGLKPRVLRIGCEDYQALTSGNEVDFDRLLRLTRDQLEAKIRAALARKGSGLVLSYGGALHNDVDPPSDLVPYAFGPAVARLVPGRYVELDLYVPEFIEKNPTIRAKPWYQVYRHSRRRGRVTLVRRGESSFALIFPSRRRSE